MKFATPYENKKVIKSVNHDPSMTKQAHKKETDINFILRKHQKTGMLTHINEHSPQYGDATSTDLHTALILIRNAQEMFDDLPSNIRNRFHNEPGQFLDFVQDPTKLEEHYEMGIKLRPPAVVLETAEVPAEPISEPTA